MNKSIQNMINKYIKESIEGYTVGIPDKYNEEDVEIITHSLNRLLKKLNQSVNQNLLKNRIADVLKKSNSPKNKQKKCKNDEIYNEDTKRCVKINGVIGKSIIAGTYKKKSRK
jgi:hypothetical protein